jgi:hypothetical protein
MKVGDKVRMKGDRKILEIKELKSDSRGIWLKFLKDPCEDSYYSSKCYEVVNESR